MKAILVIDIPPHLLNSDKFYAEVNIKPQDRRRDWHEKTVEAELKPLPEFQIVAKKELASNVKEVRLVKEGWNALVEKLSGEKYGDVVGYDEEIDDKIIKLASLVS